MQRLRVFRTRDTSREPVAAQIAETTGGPAPARDDFDAGVQVIYGAGTQSLPLVGLRIADARSLVETILRVEPRSPALVNGRHARLDYVIARGDVLEFVHHAGEKGAVWTYASR